MRRPNLFIVGAPRCGTSAMFTFLGEHPDIHASPVKEPAFFEEGHRMRTLDEYLNLFAGATSETWLLEATPFYLSDPHAAERIREFSPGAKVIAMVRNPVDAVHSLHHHRLTIRRESRADLLTAIREEHRSPEDVPPVVHHRYLTATRHGRNLERLLSAFPRDHVHVVVYDDFAADVAAIYRGVLRFLRVDETFVPRFRYVNAAATPRSRSAQRLLWGRRDPVRAIARMVLPRDLRQFVWRQLVLLNLRPQAKPPLSPDVHRELWLEFEYDVQLLSDLLGRDLDAAWRPRGLAST